MIRAMLVEDNNAFRESLKKVLSSRYRSIQLAEAENGDEVMKSVHLLPPDIIFMDIHLPGRNGLDLTQDIKILYPNTIIVILSNSDTTEYRESAYQKGASYFVPKDSSIGDFFALIDRITQGLAES
jgi:DNA-binding NarL/FixJ family response regulator